jgi:ABC-type dipeptide/oligopeptide/nickel transport system permease component
MFRHILFKLLRWIPSVLVILFVVYALLFYGAGDPIRLMFLRAPGDVAWDPERIEAMRHELGLDRSFLEQFTEYIWNVLHGNLGNSLIHQRSVSEMIKVAAPVSIQLALAAMVIMAVLGIPLGVLAAVYKNSWADNSILGTALGCWAIPTYVAGPLLVILLVRGLNLMAVPYGWEGLFSPKAIIPIMVLAFRPVAIIIRQSRSAVLEVKGEDYIRTARAKGISNYLIISRHMLRPVLTPIITALGLVVAFMIQGSILLEVVFGIPGLGRLVAEATVDSDYPVVLAVVLIGSVLVMATNLVVDILYPILDPRVRQAQTGGE